MGVGGAVQAYARGNGVFVRQDEGQFCDIHFFRAYGNYTDAVSAVPFADNVQQLLRFQLLQSV